MSENPMRDKDIINKLEELKRTLDAAIKSVKNEEYISPQGGLYCVIADASNLVRELKKKGLDLF